MFAGCLLRKSSFSISSAKPAMRNPLSALLGSTPVIRRRLISPAPRMMRAQYRQRPPQHPKRKYLDSGGQIAIGGRVNSRWLQAPATAFSGQVILPKQMPMWPETGKCEAETSSPMTASTANKAVFFNPLLPSQLLIQHSSRAHWRLSGAKFRNSLS